VSKPLHPKATDRPHVPAQVGRRELAWHRLAVGLLALSLYILTLAPSVLWGGGDFARFQVWAATLHVEGGPLGHPLWVLVAHPFTWLPIGDIAYRINLSSAAISAMALVLVWTTIWEFAGSRAGAWLGTAALAVSHTFWTYAVMPKVYALNSLLLAIALLLALRWGRTQRPVYLYGLGLVFGLGAWSHLLFFMLFVAFALYAALSARARDMPRLVLAAGCFAGLAAASFLPAGRAAGAGSTATLALQFVQQFLTVLVTPRSLGLGIVVFVAMLGYQFFATLLAAGAGLRRSWRSDRRFASLILSIVGLDVAFVFAWMPGTPALVDYAQNWHFYLPAFMVIAIIAGAGFGAVWSTWRWRGRSVLMATVLLIPVGMYLAAPRVAGRVLERYSFRSLPGRNVAVYLLAPWKHNESGPRSYGEAVFGSLPPNATLLADYSIYWIMRYLQEVEHARPDVRLVELPPPPSLERHLPIALAEAAEGRRLFMADTNRYYNVAALEEEFRIVSREPIFELVR
jgi:hypothetical protein